MDETDLFGQRAVKLKAIELADDFFSEGLQLTCKVSAIVDNPVPLSIVRSTLRCPSLGNLDDSDRKVKFLLYNNLHFVQVRQIPNFPHNF